MELYGLGKLMEFYGDMYLFITLIVLALVRVSQGRARQSDTFWRERTGRMAAATIAIALASSLAGCSSSSSIGILNIAPGNGTLFVGAPGPASAHLRHSSSKSPTKSQGARPEDFASATCGNLQYSAMATYSDGTVKDVTNQVTWDSSNTSAATIDNNGNAAGVAMGITYIEATLGKVSTGNAPLYVDQLNSLVINPPNATLPVGSPTIPTTLQFTAIGTFTQPDGTTNTRDITSLVTWSSSNTSVATIQPTGPTGGLASSVSQGTTPTTIDASVCGVSNTTQLTVGPPGPASLQITPATPTLAVGTSQPFSAIELWTDGTTHSLTGTLQWSSNSKNSIVSQFTGVAFGVSPGTATITATQFGGTESGLTGSTDITVQAAVAKFAYVANAQGNGTGSISSFTVDATGGTLTPLASTPASSPQQVLLAPSGNFLYSIDSASLVHVYQITPPGAGTPTMPEGTLTSLDNAIPPVPTGGGNTNIGVIDPTGQFLYVIDRTANTLYGFQIQQSQAGATPYGNLQPIANGAGAPFSGPNFTFSGPSWLMIDRAGQYLYVLNSGNNTISGYGINFDGTLLPVGSATQLPGTGNGPVYGTTDSQGRMFVANSADNSVSAYVINNDGTWALSQTLAIAGATAIINVKTDPAGKYLYVLDKGGASGGQIFAYPFIPPGGVSIFGDPIGQPQTVGISPNGIAIDPAGILLVVDNSGSNDLSLFTIVSGTSNNTTPRELLPTSPGTAPTDTNPRFVVFYNALRQP
jgi:6-phosphogluconolactonase (cycloisomerase 2 family)